MLADTEQFWAMDAQYGGGACRDAVVAHVQATQQMLRSTMDNAVAIRLYAALADLNTVAAGLVRPRTVRAGPAAPIPPPSANPTTCAADCSTCSPSPAPTTATAKPR